MQSNGDVPQSVDQRVGQARPVFVRVLYEAGRSPPSAHQMHQSVDAVVSAAYPFDQRLAAPAVGQITHLGMDSADVVEERGQSVFVTTDGHYFRTGPGQRPRGCAPSRTGGTGDDDDQT